MQKIKSATIKAAALVHSQKQLRALLGSNAVFAGAGNVTFAGETAFAQWTTTTDDRVMTYRINYPAMPDNSFVSRHEADLISAYTNHEIGHIAYTNHSSLLRYSAPQYSLLRNLWNGIEDGRIEHAVIASARANGARSGFKRLMSHYTSRLDEKFNPTSINNAPFALALICRAALGDGNGFAKTLLDRIPEPKRSLYKAVADAMPSLSLDRDGTGQALGLAMKFLEGWKAIEPVDQSADNPRQPQQQQQQQPQGEDDSDDDSSDGDESFDDDDSLDDGEGSELAQAEADMAETTEAGEVADVPMPSFGDEDDSEDDGESSVSKSGGDEPYEDRQEQYDEQLCKSPEPDISDVFKRIRERTLVPVSLPTAPPPGRTEMRRWQSMQKDAAGLRRSARTLSKAVLPALKSRLYQILKAPERCGWDSGSISGRFDGRRAPRMLSGSESVFKRRWVSEGINTSVSVLVDLSGSMNGWNAKSAAHLAWTIAQAAETAGAECEVVGFRSPNANDFVQYGGGRDMFGNLLDVSDRDSTRVGVLVVAKRFEDRTANVPHHFVKMGVIASGGTPDYTCLRSVVQQLSQRKSGRRLVVVITDGFGEAAKVRQLTRCSKAMFDVEVIAFGIGTSDDMLSDAYEFGAAVRHAGDLHSIALRKVIEQLKAGDTRRVA